REGPVAARGDEEILPPGRGEESLEPVVAHADTVLILQVERCLVGTQGPEEFSGRHEYRELELGQNGAAWDIHRVESRSIQELPLQARTGWRRRTALDNGAKKGAPSARRR